MIMKKSKRKVGYLGGLILRRSASCLMRTSSIFPVCRSCALQMSFKSVFASSEILMLKVFFPIKYFAFQQIRVTFVLRRLHLYYEVNVFVA